MAAARPLAESPWFWVHLFAVAALAALALAGPKFGPRQAQIEREYQGRSRAAQNLNGGEPNLPLSSPETTIVTLRPLFAGLAAIAAAAWIALWWTRRKPMEAGESSSVSTAECKERSLQRSEF